jgi:glycosyltransferase involved in cell wall biosynthesis
VLIPARNEEISIGAAIESVMALQGIEFELVVLDDGSTDRTAEIVSTFAAHDSRIRLKAAPPLPMGWNGKQHACWALASLATYDIFCFLDADVRIGPEALVRMVNELTGAKEDLEISLVSGFPQQETGTLLEKLLLPLIHFVLLGFLPLPGERFSKSAGFAAGCGQFMVVRSEAYFATGGHSSIRTTMHDGLILPQLFRTRGFQTRVYNLTGDAACRMYRSAGEVWRGLAKNATEGMASPGRIGFFTILLFAGQVAPLPLLLWAIPSGDAKGIWISSAALMLGYFVRVVSAFRYRQSWLGAALHPLGVLLLLVLQWYALLRKLAGKPATWKQRAYLAG